ncbi:MAG: hypothetical protein U0166_12985, partial [Acidobacteriota bacterium]
MTLAPNVHAPTLAVRELMSEEAGLKLRCLAGTAGLDTHVRSSRIQKPGLALLGASDYVHEGRVQVLGKSEVSFAKRLPPERLHE